MIEINDFLEEAKAYTYKINPLPSNLKYEAMKGIFEGTKNLYVRANGVKEIESASLTL